MCRTWCSDSQLDNVYWQKLCVIVSQIGKSSMKPTRCVLASYKQQGNKVYPWIVSGQSLQEMDNFLAKPISWSDAHIEALEGHLSKKAPELSSASRTTIFQLANALTSTMIFAIGRVFTAWSVSYQSQDPCIHIFTTTMFNNTLLLHYYMH